MRFGLAIFGDPLGMAALQQRGRVDEGCVDMPLQHVAYISLLPIAIGLCEEVGDVLGVGVGRSDGLVRGGLVASFGLLYHRDGGPDVLLEQFGQSITGRITVKRFDRVADIGLVLQQTRSRGVEGRRASGERRDRRIGPLHVLCPQVLHCRIQGAHARRAVLRRSDLLM